jgi:hypothetical protein
MSHPKVTTCFRTRQTIHAQTGLTQKPASDPKEKAMNEEEEK